MIIGYALSGSDNGSFAFFERNDVPRCSDCGYITDKTFPLTDLKIKKRRFDYSVTYDGIKIASQQFVDLCRQSGFTNVDFEQLPDDAAFYRLTSRKTVPFDSDRVGTRFEGYCQTCKNYKSIVGVTPRTLVSGTKVAKMSICRTDLEFASADEKSPLIICGLVAAEILRESKLRGFNLKPVEV